MGKDALSKLIAGLDSVPQDQKGKIALTIAELWEHSASDAVQKIIEYFPLEPKEEVGININKPANQEEVNILRTKYGEGSLSSQSYGGSHSDYFYVIQAPAAVAALFKITGECPGITKQSWVKKIEEKK